MAVSLTATDYSGVGTGSTATYATGIYANASDQIKVYEANVLQTLGDDYSLNGLGSSTGVDVIGSFASGATIYIERVTPITQLVDTQNNETILEDVLDGEFDKLTMIAQEIGGKADRALLVPKGEVGFTLAAAAARAGYYLAFDANGDPVLASGIGADNALRTDMAASTSGNGAGLLAYLYSSTYATGTVGKRLQDYISIKDAPFNAKGDGVTDDMPAITAAATVALALNKKLYAPAGKYRCASRGTINFTNAAVGLHNTTAVQSLTIEGDGQDVTTFYWDGTDGLLLNFSSQQHSVHFRNMTFSCGTTGTKTAIEFTNSYAYFGTFNAHSDFTNVTFRGDDGYAKVKHWKTGVKVANVQTINFINCLWTADSNGTSGTGVVLDSPGAGTFVPTTLPSSFTAGTVYNFVNCNFSFIGTGIYYGNNIQTVQVDNCFFAQVTNSIACPSGIYNNSNQGLIVRGSTFFGIGEIIVVNSPLNNIQITDNLFVISAGKIGIFIQPNVNCTITGNQFIPYGNPNTAAAGIELQGLAPGSIQSIDILTVGSGYTVGAAAVVSGGGGGVDLAVTVASVDGSGGITGLTITNRGTGYVSAPTLTFPGGAGATFRVNLVTPTVTIIDDNTFSSVTNGIILDNNCSGVMIGLGNHFTPGMTNNILDTGTGNISDLTHTTVGLRSNNPSKGIGYSGSARGSVVQATSKTTGVTLNNICGRVTTNNAALGAGAEALFTVTNSAMLAVDMVVVICDNTNYRVRAASRGNGSFQIGVTNITGGSLSDAVVIDFMILRNG